MIIFIFIYRRPKNASQFRMQITRQTFSLQIQFRYFSQTKISQNPVTVSVLIRESTEYKTRNQVQIVFMIKCIEVSKITLTIHIAHLFTAAWILFI